MASRRLVPWGILTRYLSRQLLGPFLLGFSVVTFLLSLDFLLDYLDLFLGKGIPLPTVLHLFTLGLGWMVALSVPCGVLVAVLMVFGQMSQDNEITALRASGVNPFHTMMPALVIALIVATGLTLFNNYVLPETNHAFANLVAQIHRIRPTAQIKEGIFLDDFEGYNLFIGKLDDRTGEMRDVLIIDSSQNRKSPRTILAKRGRLRYLPDRSSISLELADGIVHEADPETADGRYRRLVFEEQVMVLEGTSEAFAKAVKRNRGQREMSVAQMHDEIRTLERERASFQAIVDSSLVRMGVVSPDDLPDLDLYELEPAGARKLVAAVLGFLGVRRAPPMPPEQIPQERRRQIEDLRIRVIQIDSIEKRMDQFRVEVQKKFSIPFACIVFVLVGAPLGMRARRGGLAVGFLSVAFFLFYYLCLIGGEQLADRGYLAPWLAMWLPNLVLGIAGARLSWRIATSGYSITTARRVRG